MYAGVTHELSTVHNKHVLHVVKLLLERQRLIIHVKVGMFNYCFIIRVSDNMLVFVVVFVSRFGRCSVRNVVAGYRRVLCRGYGFVSL